MSATGTAGSVQPASDERLAYRGVFQRLLIRPEVGAAIGAIAIWIFFWSVSVPFGKAGGAASILDVASSPLGIMAVAVAMLMIGGEFDLSSGAATGALGILTVLLVRDVAELAEVAGGSFSLWLALPISLMAALGLGWFNGTLVNKTSLPSFIVTLASFFILKGAKLGFSKLIVEQIQVGKLNDLEIHAAETGASDNGYGILRKVFAAEWQRNEHIWEARDSVYMIGAIAGCGLLALAVHELHFTRRERLHPLGFVLAVLGVVGGLVGVWWLHNTDAVAGNQLGAIIIGISMLVGFFGWCLWRYEMQRPTGGLRLGGPTLIMFGAGIAAFLAAIFVARWFDAQNSTDLTEAFDLSGPRIVAFSIIGGALTAAVIARNAGGPVSFRGRQILSSFTAPLIAFVIGFGATIAGLYLATEQGARAILFMSLAAASAIALLMAVSRARRDTVLSGSILLMITAGAVTLMAFFIRSQSADPKFRTQAFSFMLVIAALMACWAVATMFFAERRFRDARPDRFGRVLAIVGVLAIVAGVTARLLFVTQGELDAGIPLTKFSVRILWFLGFTAVATWVLGRTRFGSWTFAVGGNKQAARQVGVPASRTKTQLFMLVSVAAWLVGLLLAFRLNTIQASTGDGEEFEYIIAAVVGGTALTGGYGSTLGAAIGAVIMAMAVQGIPSARWNSDWRFVFVGAILLLAVIANNFIRSKAEAAR